MKLMDYLYQCFQDKEFRNRLEHAEDDEERNRVTSDYLNVCLREFIQEQVVDPIEWTPDFDPVEIEDMGEIKRLEEIDLWSFRIRLKDGDSKKLFFKNLFDAKVLFNSLSGFTGN
ncbi:MAG: hypothetical protein GY866_27350 [Proteobacteria bacterium]|nr:hypothetical protein [Pseudomonadota bacterium]